jgi:hypothetical protein
MRLSDIDIDLHMVNKTLSSKILDRNNIFLSFFWKGYYVSCYWHPISKEISLINSHYEFSDKEVKTLAGNFSVIKWAL